MPALPLALLLALTLTLTACGCPTLVERWDTPEDTLAQWQARLCRDDVQGEYGCLSASFQRSFHGFQNYYAARGALLAERPAAAWVLKHADLAAASEPATYTPDGRHAQIVLDAQGERVIVDFECEAWVTITYADGSTRAVRQNGPPAALLGVRGDQQWVSFDRPVIEPGRAADVRAVRIDPRWLIANLAGLGATSPAPLE